MQLPDLLRSGKRREMVQGVINGVGESPLCVFDKATCLAEEFGLRQEFCCSRQPRTTPAISDLRGPDDVTPEVDLKGELVLYPRVVYLTLVVIVDLLGGVKEICGKIV